MAGLVNRHVVDDLRRISASKVSHKKVVGWKQYGNESFGCVICSQ